MGCPPERIGSPVDSTALTIAINGRFLSQSMTGVQRMAFEFTRALDRLIAEGQFPGLDVRLLVQPGADTAGLGLTSIQVETLRGWRGHWWEQLTLPHHHRSGWLLNLGNTAPLWSLLSDRLVAVVVHDISYRTFPTAYRIRYRLAHRLLDKVLMRRAERIFTVAETERRTIAAYYPEATSRIVVAQNGGLPDDPHREPPALRPTEHGYGIYVGSLSRRKNVETIIATAIILARTRGLRFKIAGTSSPILSGIAYDIPDDVSHMIDFCGQIDSPSDLAQLYCGADFLLFPSLYEASALPPIEAMAQGCPVILSRIPSLLERCGDAAAYCDPRDPASILAAIENVLDDAPFRAMLIERGFRRASQLSWRSQAIRIIRGLQHGADRIAP